MSGVRQENSGERRAAGAARGPIPQELVDRFFDRELDEPSREQFFGMLRQDLSRCAEVAKTQRIVSMLREPVETPDLTGRILDRVGRRRGFMPESMRRWVKAGRLAAAACVLFAVLGFAVGRRYAPDFFRFAPEAQPVTQVIDSSRNEAAAVIVGTPATAAPTGAGGPGSAKPAVRKPFTVVQLEPGKTSVRTLPTPPADDRLVVYLGSGGEARFVVQDGVVIDRATSVTLPVFSAAAPDAVLEWIKVLKAGMGAAPVAGVAEPNAGCTSASTAGQLP